MWRQRKPNSCEGRSVIMWMNLQTECGVNEETEWFCMIPYIKVQSRHSSSQAGGTQDRSLGKEWWLWVGRRDFWNAADVLFNLPTGYLRCVQFLKTCGAVHMMCALFCMYIMYPEKYDADPYLLIQNTGRHAGPATEGRVYLHAPICKRGTQEMVLTSVNNSLLLSQMLGLVLFWLFTTFLFFAF